MASTDDPTALDRLAATLDAAGVDLELLRRDFPAWRVWHSEVTGAYHARRNENFHDRGDGRRFHLAAATPGRLALLLLAQSAMDAELLDSGGET